VATPGDAASLAGHIERLADDPAARETMGRRSREAALMFARDRQIALHAGVIQEVAGRA
jgi:glycosyltransferase involved in cell wall biosynthesis